MQNKTVSIVSTAIMALLFVIGLVLIWNNISIAPSSDEDLSLTDQEFYSTSKTVKAENGKPTTETTIDYEIVIDKKEKKAYHLAEGKELDYAKLMQESPKEVLGKEFNAEDDIHYLAQKEYDFQKATKRSINFTWWLSIIALIAIGVFTVLNIAKNPKRFLRSAIGFVALIIIAFICYKVAAPVGEGKMLETSNYTDSGFHYTGAGIALTFVLALIAIALILWQSVVNLLRFFTK